MTSIRHASENELPELFTLPGVVLVAIKDDLIVGHVAIRKIQGLVWITDLKAWSDEATVAARLCSRAREEVKNMGYSEYRLTIDPNEPALFEVLVNKGHELSSIVLKGVCK